MSEAALIECKAISKSFWRAKERLDVLHGLDLSVPSGAFLALMGPSGSGKSTLLNLMAGLDTPSEGTVSFDGQQISSMSDAGRGAWRAQNVGFVFQSFNLIPVLTAEQNVELPLLLTKLSASERKERARIALKVVGLSDREDHLPKQLSGGQEQRVAIARAIVHDPRLIVADEPTGDLDRTSANDIMQLLTKLNKEFGKTILMVTHDPDAAAFASRTYHLNKGQLQ